MRKSENTAEVGGDFIFGQSLISCGGTLGAAGVKLVWALEVDWGWLKAGFKFLSGYLGVC